MYVKVIFMKQGLHVVHIQTACHFLYILRFEIQNCCDMGNNLMPEGLKMKFPTIAADCQSLMLFIKQTERNCAIRADIQSFTFTRVVKSVSG